jgi:hypothetical protein
MKFMVLTCNDQNSFALSCSRNFIILMKRGVTHQNFRLYGNTRILRVSDEVCLLTVHCNAFFSLEKPEFLHEAFGESQLLGIFIVGVKGTHALWCPASEERRNF